MHMHTHTHIHTCVICMHVYTPSQAISAIRSTDCEFCNRRQIRTNQPEVMFCVLNHFSSLLDIGLSTALCPDFTTGADGGNRMITIWCLFETHTYESQQGKLSGFRGGGLGSGSSTW